jgi:diguanylate cyclase (GGDEF)-like protein
MQGASATTDFGSMPAAADAVRRAILRSVGPVSIAFLDIAGLGLVNRRLGRAAGDSLLKRFEDRLTALAEAPERVWRLGGDEFLLLLPDRSARSARRRVRRLRRTMAEDGLVFRSGGATARPGAGTAWELYLAAGQAMRTAKRHRLDAVWTPAH